MARAVWEHLHFFSALAGAALGAWLAGAWFGRSWTALAISAVLGLFVLGPLVLHGALGAAGVVLGMSSRSAPAKVHPVQAHRLAAILIIALALTGLVGVLVVWLRS